MSLGHIGQDCFPSKCTGTHSEGALTEPGPPQELGHQAGAADGQSRTESYAVQIPPLLGNGASGAPFPST